MATGTAPKDPANTEEKKNEIVFLVEVLEVAGLPRPEKTSLQLTGFGLEKVFSSLTLDEESSDPSGWMFLPSGTPSEAPPVEEVAAPKGKAKAKADPKKVTPDPNQPPADEGPPAPHARLTHPCNSKEQQQKLLDTLVGSALNIDLMNVIESDKKPLGRVSLNLEDLIHSTSMIETEKELAWSQEFVTSCRRELQERLEAERTAAQEAANAEAEAHGTEPVELPEVDMSSQVPELLSGSPPRIRIRISTAGQLGGGPIGRVLCAEDLDDWTTLTVSIDGCYSLPEALLLPSPLPEGHEGILEDHPLSYSMRILGCKFDLGQLVLPPLPEPPPQTEGDPPTDAVETEENADPNAGDDVSGGGLSPTGQTAFQGSIGKEEFLEGLVRTGFSMAHKVGDALFDFLDTMGSGVVGPDEFARLADIEVLADSSKLVALSEHVVGQHSSISEAFNAFDSNSTNSLSLNNFLEYVVGSYEVEAEEKAALGNALKDESTQQISAASFQMLSLLRRAAELKRVGKVSLWLLQLLGSLDDLWQQADNKKTGSVSLERWQSTVAQLGYQNAEDSEIAFKLIDVSAEGSIRRPSLELLNRLGSPMEGGLLPLLVKFQAMIEEKVGGVQEFLDLLSEGMDLEAIQPHEFSSCCDRLGWDGLTLHPLVIFSMLDEGRSGRISSQQLELHLEAVRLCARLEERCRLYNCKVFLTDSFGSPENIFRNLFEDFSEQSKVAEEKSPRIEFVKNSVTVYRGRTWLQQLFNTTGDSRGRNLTGKEANASGGAWLYFFPTPKGKTEAVDYKEVTDPTQSAPARVARWHHAHGFVDLRRLLADAEGDDDSVRLSFKVYLSQSLEQPSELLEDQELPKAPFGVPKTFVKGSIRLGSRVKERRRLNPCPDTLEAIPEGWMLPPPEKPPPPTSSEELETESHRVVAKLASEFAKFCREQGLEEPNNAPNGHGVIRVLGRGVQQREFLNWLAEQDNGAVFRDLSNEVIRPVVRLIRSDHPDAPACGIKGNQQDAAYTYLHNLIHKHIVRSLNGDVDMQSQLRDGQLWRDAGLVGPPPGELGKRAIQDEADSAHGPTDETTLKRLIFEYELCGDWDRATELFQARLRLPQNAEKGEIWYDYARFLMRTGQRQEEAENALRFAICLRPPDVGPSIKEVLFLASIMMNKDLPTSLEANGLDYMRFDVALQLLSKYVDQHPCKKTPLFFLFAIYALEAANFKSILAAAGGNAMGGGSQKRADSLASFAAKYLELARTPTKAFEGTLTESGFDGKPLFRDLQDLVYKERLARGELENVPSDRPQHPESWAPDAYPPLASFNSVHALEDPGDEAALSCIDLLLHFGVPGFLQFLFAEAAYSYGFLSQATVESERCQLQCVKAMMLQCRWDEAIVMLNGLLERGDRLRDAHLLLGECKFRAANDQAGVPGAQGSQVPLDALQEAQRSFETALSFLPEQGPAATSIVPSDSVVHFRLANLQFTYAQITEFTDAVPMAKAMYHYKRSLLISPTAEVWFRAGVCTYRQACLGRKRSLFRCKEPAPAYQAAEPETVKKRQSGFKEASKYLTEANMLDVTRPQTNAWLVICAVEMGQVQIAKQALRQVFSYDYRLDAATCLEMAVVLLRCSDESRAGPGERKWLVEDGRYANEAILAANLLLSMKESGEVHYVLGLAHVMLGNDAAAFPHFQAALPWFNHDAPCQDEINLALRSCSSRLNGGSGFVVGPVTVPAPPTRTAAQEAEFQERLETTRSGGAPAGVADFALWKTGFEVYDHDLAVIMEAVFEGGIISLILIGSRIGIWGVREIVLRIRESPGSLQEIDVTRCAAVGELGKELVNTYPYKRGVSMEASSCGLPEEDVVRLRNRDEDAAKTLRRMAAEQDRSQQMGEDYKARQDILEQLANEESNQDPPPEPPAPPYCPSRWTPGLEARARQEYRAFLVANPTWGMSGDEYYDAPVTTVVARNGESILIQDDYETVLRRSKIEMLQQEGYIRWEDQEAEEPGELDELQESDQQGYARLTKLPPPSYAALFGPNLEGYTEATVLESRRLLAFMVWDGVRASADAIAAIVEKREEIEKEEEELAQRRQRLAEEMQQVEERRRKEWEEKYRDLVEGRNSLATRAKEVYDSRQLPKGVGSGQIIAHFTYICLDMNAKLGAKLKRPSDFGLKTLSEAPRTKPRRGHDLHEALFTGKVSLEEATGTSFGQDAVQVKLRSLSSEPMEIAIRRGTIFQHVDWVHRQNLLVAIDYLVSIPAGGCAEKLMLAYCMNLTCACSSGNPMELTEFYTDASAVLDSQGNVWDHFESCFQQHRILD